MLLGNISIWQDRIGNGSNYKISLSLSLIYMLYINKIDIKIKKMQNSYR